MLSQAERTISRYPMLRYLLDEPAWDSNFLTSVRLQFQRSGYLTHTQAVTACRIIAEERAKKHYMQARSEDIEARGLVVPSGWTTVTGMVKSVRWSWRSYRMLLDGFDGYRVFGPIPGFLFTDYKESLDELKGRVVTFEADLKPKGEDFAVYDDCRACLSQERSSASR